MINRDWRQDAERSKVRRLYSTSRWKRLRSLILSEHPLCVYCEQVGEITPATVVDHIKPHRGDVDLFWDTNNLQTLCKHCHDSIKQAEEHGNIKGVDESGYSLGFK